MVSYQRKNKKNIKYKRNYVTLLIILFLLLLITFYFMIFTDIFNINEIQVNDNKVVKSEEIILKSGLNSGQNIFMFSKNEVIKSIEEIPYVKKVSLIRVFPNKIKLFITEREPICIIPCEGKYLYVDSEMIILDYIKEINNYKIPLITGNIQSIGTISIGNPIQIEPVWVEKNIFEIIKLFSKKNILQNISEINITDEKFIHIYTMGGSIIKIKDNDTVKNKINFIKTYIEENDNRMIIDMTHGGNPTYKPR